MSSSHIIVHKELSWEMETQFCLCSGNDIEAIETHRKIASKLLFQMKMKNAQTDVIETIRQFHNTC